MNEVWSAALFFGILLLDYLIWFHVWPWGVQWHNRRHPDQECSPEREAALALRGFLATLGLLAILGIGLWLITSGR